jgi:16S rRNA (cytosine967-C5)-methyltransferase
VVEDLLAERPGFTADDLTSDMPVWKHPTMPRHLQTLPHRDGTEGFFIARLRLQG